eukprot:g68087.t1
MHDTSSENTLFPKEEQNQKKNCNKVSSYTPRTRVACEKKRGLNSPLVKNERGATDPTYILIKKTNVFSLTQSA